MRSLKPRQRQILTALHDLGGQANTKQIAEKAGLNTNGVSQSLGALNGTYVQLVGRDGRQDIWKLVRVEADGAFKLLAKKGFG